MARPLQKLDSVPDDHTVVVTSWQLLNNFTSDSVVEERSFIADQSIVIIVRSAGAFAKVSVSDGLGEASENLARGQTLIVHVTGFGDKVAYRIKVKAENLTNKLTSTGAPLFEIVTVRTLAPLPPSPPPQLRPPQPPVSPAPPPAPVRVHIVKKGEFLRKIAKLYYGDENKWKTIYDANRNTIGNNPNLIFPGQRLTIP